MLSYGSPGSARRRLRSEWPLAALRWPWRGMGDGVGEDARVCRGVGEGLASSDTEEPAAVGAGSPLQATRAANSARTPRIVIPCLSKFSRPLREPDELRDSDCAVPPRTLF